MHLSQTVGHAIPLMDIIHAPGSPLDVYMHGCYTQPWGCIIIIIVLSMSCLTYTPCTHTHTYPSTRIHMHATYTHMYAHTKAASFNFSIALRDCLPGFVLRQSATGGNLLTCSCVNSDFSILTCNPENSIVLRVFTGCLMALRLLCWFWCFVDI